MHDFDNIHRQKGGIESNSKYLKDLLFLECAGKLFGGSECRKKKFPTSKNISNEGSTALHVVPHRQAGGISNFSIWPYCSKYTYKSYLKKLDSKSKSLNSESLALPRLHRQHQSAFNHQ